MNYFTAQRRILKRILGIVALLVPVALAGCATADKNVRLDYHPTIDAVGGTGELYVAISAERDSLAKRSGVEWILGEIKDDDGKPLGKLLTNMEPKGLVADAIIQELKAAGFKVKVVQSLPTDAAKGLVFSGITLKLNEVEGVVKAQAKGSVQVKMEVWKGGAKVKQLDYEEATSNSVMRTNTENLDKTLQETVTAVTRRAIPDLMQALEN
jgi:hypothetical protein